MTFLTLLAQQGLIKEQDVDVVQDEAHTTKTDVEDILLKRGIAKEAIMKARAEYSSVPVKELGDEKVPFDVLKYIPEESASYYKFAPLSVTDGVLEVGMVDPGDIEARDALQFISSKSGVPFKIVLISKEDLGNILETYSGLTGEVTKALSQLDPEDEEKASAESGGAHQSPEDKADEEVEDDGEDGDITEDAPVTKIVGVILRHATEGNASDVHVEHMGERVRVRFRVDGELFTSLILPRNVHNAVIARIKILSKLKLDEKRKPQDGRFTARIEKRLVDFRVSTFPTHYGEKIVMRILDSQKGIRKLEELGLSVRNLAVMKQALKAPYGMILITGPTGSGKSTTLYSMLNAVDREKQNVVSLENPVEYNIPGMSQSQVRPEIGYTFASGLRSILRQDPDIIMVGEIRDKETAQLAIQAALTGHLVFATLHTNSAVGAVPRLIDMGIDPYLIAPTLILSIAQRLVKVLCPSSRKEIEVNESMQMMIDKQFADLPEEFRAQLDLEGTFYRAVASAECPSGTRGRAAVVETFAIDQDIESIILKNPVEPELWKAARAKGMLSMHEDAILKALKGVTPFEEINKI